jgi:multidrug resistance efflux pump
MPPTTQHIEIRSEEVQEILTAVPHWMIRWGNTLVFIIVLGLLAISWLVSYPDIINSEAVITTLQPPQKIIANTSGKIDTLLIKDNDYVRKGSPLAVIENTANFEDVLFLKSIVDTITLKKQGFELPIEDIPILFLGDIDTYYANFENDYQQYTLNKKLKPYNNEAIANSSSLSQLRFRLKNLKIQKTLHQAELELKTKEFERDKSMYAKGVISLQRFETSEAAYLRAQNTYVSNDTSISQTLEAISNANKTARGTSINSTKEDIELLKKVFQSFSQLRNAIRNWESKYVLKSDIDGKVTILNFWNQNQTVNQGNRIFTVIPVNNSNYIAKLKTPAQNSGKVKTGQKVQLRLQDFPDNEYGILEGTISRISAITDEDGLYLVDVTLPKTLITSYKKEIPFKQEMLANGEIITEDLRLIERFFYQLKNVFKN